MSALERAVAAVADFTARPPHLGCVHVVRDQAGPMVCGQHPAAGLMCPRCCDRHVRRHDVAEERTCDQCRSVVEAIHPAVVTTKLVGGPIRDPRGHHRMFAGTIAVVGVGTCRSCHATSGRAVVDIPAAVLASGWRP